MAEFNEIEKMQAFVRVMTPYIQSNLGVLINPENGTETTTPAFYLDDNFVPESTLPRVLLGYAGSQNGHVTQVRTYQENNPDYDPQDPQSPEFLYFIERSYHTEYALTLSIDSGDTSSILEGGRKSANFIARQIRKLLGRNSVRDQLHIEMDSGIDYIVPETPQTDLNGVTLVGSSLMTINFTTLDQEIEQVDGVVDRVEYKGTLYEVSEEDPNPIVMNRVFIAPPEY